MYEDMIGYVQNYLKKPDNKFLGTDSKYPFRNTFEHCLRVYNWAVRINDVEKGSLDVVCIAAIFHDVGKAVANDKTHGHASACICDAYLRSINYPAFERKQIVHAIEVHHFKEDPTLALTLEEKILMDADLLDEVGALTAIWDSMATVIEGDPTYLKVYYRLNRFFEKLTRKGLFVKTDYGKKLYKERIKFIEYFLCNLKFELGIEDE